MAYFPPYIDSTGIKVPTYQEILDYLVSQAKSIFGNDIYLENDSQDYQSISITARAISDSFNALVIEYNQRSPRSAIGAGLSSLVRINGIVRNPATYSTCVVKITGTTGTTINNGIVQDTTGNQWYLPAIVTIPALGYVYVTSICSVSGPITALIGEINAIITPTLGWASVLNEVAAVAGSAEETDAALRSRQKVSSSLPSRTILEGTLAALLEVDGVTRARVYENDTNATDSNGLPPHSIAAVVEGGDSTDIAESIFYKKNPGVYTEGTTLVEVTDSYGTVTDIRFTITSYVDVRVTVTIKMLTGYSSAYKDSIKANLLAYLNGLNIGETVYNSSLWQASLSAVDSLNNPTFSVLGVVAAEGAAAQTTADVVVGHNEVSSGQLVYMVVVET